MAEETAAATAGDEDVEQLKTELERLKSENESLKSGKPGGMGARTIWAIVIALVASLLFTIAVPAVWLNRVVMDTDTWVATMAPLGRRSRRFKMRSRRRPRTRSIEALDAQARLEAILPQQLQQLAPIIASSAEGLIKTQTTNLVRSDKFSEIWSELNRVGHSALIAALTGSRDGAVKYEPGVLTLDVGVLAQMVQDKLVETGLPFLGKLPVSSINKQIEIFNSPALAQASVALGLMNQIAYLIPLFAILLSAGAFALATDRRKVALWLGGGIVLAGLLPLQAIYLAQYPVASQLQELAGLPTAAAQNAYNIIFAQLIASEQVLTVFGLLDLRGSDRRGSGQVGRRDARRALRRHRRRGLAPRARPLRRVGGRAQEPAQGRRPHRRGADPAVAARPALDGPGRLARDRRGRLVRGGRVPRRWRNCPRARGRRDRGRCRGSARRETPATEAPAAEAPAEEPEPEAAPAAPEPEPEPAPEPARRRAAR